MSICQHQRENLAKTLVADISAISAKSSAVSGRDSAFSAALATVLASTTTFGTVAL